MHLWPDFGRIEVVKHWESWSDIGVIVFVALMVVCEFASNRLSAQKDQLASRPRALSTRQREALLLALRNEVPAAVGLSSPPVREHEVLLNQLDQVFRDSGWKAQRNITNIPEQELESGILFLSYAGSTPESNPDFSGLERAFQAAHIEFKRVRLPWKEAYANGVRASDPVIVVGSRFDY